MQPPSSPNQHHQSPQHPFDQPHPQPIYTSIMKFTATAAVLALSASLVVAEPIVRPTPAPVRRQDIIPSDIGDLSPSALSSAYAAATSALESSGQPASFISEERSSLDAAFSSAFDALSSLGGGISMAATDIASEVSSVLNSASTAVSSEASGIGSELTSLLSSLSTQATSVASSVSSAATSAASSASSAAGTGAAGPSFHVDAPISLAITGAVGLFAAVLVL